MSVFVDSSALLAILNAEDLEHANASAIWRKVLASQKPMVTTNYVLLETFAVAQHRVGLAAIRCLEEDLFPILDVEWITQEDHAAGVAGVLAAGRRHLSLVDATSFTVMRRLGLKKCFAFDPHFKDQGFEILKP